VSTNVEPGSTVALSASTSRNVAVESAAAMACIAIGAGISVNTEPTTADRATVRPRLARDITFIPGPLMCPTGSPHGLTT
jgi:hypothetical protein